MSVFLLVSKAFTARQEFRILKAMGAKELDPVLHEKFLEDDTWAVLAELG